MFRKIAVSFMFAAFASVAAEAADFGDIGQEVKAGDITMTAQDTGSITVKICSSCPERTLETTQDTTYEIGDQLVRRETLRAELLQRPRQLMLLQLTPDRKHVARLKITPAAH